MQVVERSALVTFTPAQMFALVNDVPRYPEFLPWCVAVRVDEVSATERIAMLKIAHGVLQTEFTTRNTLTPDAQIDMRLTHGPFRDLTGVWRFDAIGARVFRLPLLPDRVRQAIASKAAGTKAAATKVTG